MSQRTVDDHSLTSDHGERTHSSINGNNCESLPAQPFPGPSQNSIQAAICVLVLLTVLKLSRWVVIRIRVASGSRESFPMRGIRCCQRLNRWDSERNVQTPSKPQGCSENDFAGGSARPAVASWPAVGSFATAGRAIAFPMQGLLCTKD